MVLDAIIGSARKQFGYFRPPVAVDLVGHEEFLLLLRGPGPLHYFRVKMIVPSE